ALETELRPAFAGASIYPDFSEALAGITTQLFAAGESDRGLQAAELAYRLYPESAQACKSLAIAQLCTGDAHQAQALIGKAVAAGDPDIAGPGVLRDHAYDVYHLGKGKAAIALLRVAAELYPKDASLFDALGDLCAAQGLKDEAIAAYGKALAIDP